MDQRSRTKLSTKFKGNVCLSFGNCDTKTNTWSKKSHLCRTLKTSFRGFLSFSLFDLFCIKGCAQIAYGAVGLDSESNARKIYKYSLHKALVKPAKINQDTILTAVIFILYSKEQVQKHTDTHAPLNLFIYAVFSDYQLIHTNVFSESTNMQKM